MAEQHETRAYFLNEFVKSLIKISLPAPNKSKFSSLNISPEIHETTLLALPIPREIPVATSERISLDTGTKIITLKEIEMSEPHSHNYTPARDAVQPATKSPKIPPKMSFWGRISTFMFDEAVEIIECLGPEKPLVIIRNSKPIPVILYLTNEEIQSIIENIARETNTQSNTSFIRAESSTYSMTAVMSELVGSRFVIQKKKSVPFMRIMR